MSAHLQSMTVEEFISWEDQQPAKYEFDGLSPRLMTGGTESHAGIQRNIIRALANRLVGKPCRIYGSELKLRVAGAIRYPDAFITCTRTDRRATVADNPVVVFEIISRSSQRVDRIDKLREYQLTPSIRQYVLLEQDIAMANVYSREGLNWTGRVLYASDILDLPEIGVLVPMSELHLDVDVETSPDAKSPPPEEDGAF